jgi:hypothetical protein
MQKGKKQEREEEGHLEDYKRSAKSIVLKTGSSEKNAKERDVPVQRLASNKLEKLTII